MTARAESRHGLWAWLFHRTPRSTAPSQAELALNEARARRQRIEARTARIEAVSDSLRDERARNHFALRIDAAFGETRKDPS